MTNMSAQKGGVKFLGKEFDVRKQFKDFGQTTKAFSYITNAFERELTDDDTYFTFESKEAAEKFKKDITDELKKHEGLDKTIKFVDKLVGINKKKLNGEDKYVVYGKKSQVLYNENNWKTHLFNAMKESIETFENPSQYDYDSWKNNVDAFIKAFIPAGLGLDDTNSLNELYAKWSAKIRDKKSSGGTRRRKRGGRKSKAKKSSKNKTNKKRKRKGSKKSRK